MLPPNWDDPACLNHRTKNPRERRRRRAAASLNHHHPNNPPAERGSARGLPRAAAYLKNHLNPTERGSARGNNRGSTVEESKSSSWTPGERRGSDRSSSFQVSPRNCGILRSGRLPFRIAAEMSLYLAASSQRSWVDDDGRSAAAHRRRNENRIGLVRKGTEENCEIIGFAASQWVGGLLTSCVEVRSSPLVYKGDCTVIGCPHGTNNSRTRNLYLIIKGKGFPSFVHLFLPLISARGNNNELLSYINYLMARTSCCYQEGRVGR